jgi:2-keto-4-pentenoate hydratase/2-oxohepta-3-ene-1,7-dioic acid hydratase in catechol pathway
MRFCRYITKEGTRYGLVENVDGRDTITHELPGPQLQVSEAGVPQRVVIPEASQARKLDEPLLLDRAKLLIPMPIVSKILCVGRNYAEHAKELGNEVPAEPLIFSKPPSALLASGGAIVRPPISQRVDFEGELGVVIGRTIRNLHPDWDVRDYILGYTCLNDVTARDLQKKDGQWTRAKGFDTFCPVGPVIATEGVDPWAGVSVQTRVNGELKQDGNTSDFIFKLDRIIHHISQFCTLLPGDIIATGTPAGIAALDAGDLVEVFVEGIGILRNTVVDEQS